MNIIYQTGTEQHRTVKNCAEWYRTAQNGAEKHKMENNCVEWFSLEQLGTEL